MHLLLRKHSRNCSPLSLWNLSSQNWTPGSAPNGLSVLCFLGVTKHFQSPDVTTCLSHGHELSEANWQHSRTLQAIVAHSLSIQVKVVVSQIVA